ncbi:MAG TPA: hypothetical protein VG387_02580 [Rhizomicrobium sp.]|jgi:hypothetical protein|nr:hypothetical protein [Rhizomicrobium sp.]
MTEPSVDHLAPADAIARFIATGDDAVLDGVFARDVTIIENFAPHIFRDAGTWRTAMHAHRAPLADLAYAFAPALDFTQKDGRAFFTIPVTWTGALRGRRFRELGGKSIVLQSEAGAWRVAAYAWSVIEMRFD